MSEEHVHNIFYQLDGAEFAHRIKDFCAGRRYNVIFNLYELQKANAKNIPKSGVSILLLTPDMCDFISSGRHPDLNVLFPNPDVSIAILFHVEKTKDKVVSFLSSRIRNINKWTILDFGTDSSLSPIVINIIAVIEKLEEKSDITQQKFRVWTREGMRPHEQAILIFAEPVDEDAQVKVFQEWDGLNATAERLNPMTYSFSLGDAEPGDKYIEVLVNDTTYGNAVLHVMPVEPKMEQIFKILNNVINPIELLCQCLNVVSSTRENLDKTLVDLLSENTSVLNNIFEEFDWGKYGGQKSDLELPTLLHFGAKYGFRYFCVELLKLPGGKQALMIKNKDGLLPHQIAQKEGFDHLKLILQKYGRDDLYDLPKPVDDFRGPNAKSQTLPSKGKGTHALGRSESDISLMSNKKQTKERLSNTTVDRPRFVSSGEMNEESPLWSDVLEKTPEQLRLFRKMTKVTAARDDEEQYPRKRNNSVPELPRYGRVTRKERPYEELD